MSKIIAFTGKKRSGKTTAADYLVGKGFTKINFKDALIEELKQNLPDLLTEIEKVMDTIEYDGNNPWTIERLFTEKPPLMRKLLQNWGTEFRRNSVSLDYWVVKWMQKTKGVDLIVVDDLRYPEEMQAIRDMDGVVVRIIRNDMVSTDTHTSETEMDQIIPDQTIAVATGQQDELYMHLEGMLEELNFPSFDFLQGHS